MQKGGLAASTEATHNDTATSRIQKVELVQSCPWSEKVLVRCPFVRHSARFAAVCGIAIWCLAGTEKNDPTLYLFAVAFVAVVTFVVDLVVMPNLCVFIYLILFVYI